MGAVDMCNGGQGRTGVRSGSAAGGWERGRGRRRPARERERAHPSREQASEQAPEQCTHARVPKLPPTTLERCVCPLRSVQVGVPGRQEHGLSVFLSFTRRPPAESRWVTWRCTSSGAKYRLMSCTVTSSSCLKCAGARRCRPPNAAWGGGAGGWRGAVSWRVFSSVLAEGGCSARRYREPTGPEGGGEKAGRGKGEARKRGWGRRGAVGCSASSSCCRKRAASSQAGGCPLHTPAPLAAPPAVPPGPPPQAGPAALPRGHPPAPAAAAAAAAGVDSGSSGGSDSDSCGGSSSRSSDRSNRRRLPLQLGRELNRQKVNQSVATQRQRLLARVQVIVGLVVHLLAHVDGPQAEFVPKIELVVDAKLRSSRSASSSVAVRGH